MKNLIKIFICLFVINSKLSEQNLEFFDSEDFKKYSENIESGKSIGYYSCDGKNYYFYGDFKIVREHLIASDGSFPKIIKKGSRTFNNKNDAYKFAEGLENLDIPYTWEQFEKPFSIRIDF
ncbi:MAG: hypothetical protein B6I24_10645 [Bacteroidetes bacterium 4572_128]|nr:MAG: hypothetical protein B6I24_10645 [Bacteroidetes bacterium 4572_128]